MPNDFHLNAPEGFVDFDERARPRVSSRATGYLRVLPLRREARLLLTLRGGGDDSWDVAVRARIGSEVVSAWGARLRAGLWRVTGVPYFRGAPLRVRAAPSCAPHESERVSGGVDEFAGAWVGRFPQDGETWITAVAELEEDGIPFRRPFVVRGCGGRRHSRSQERQGTLDLFARREDGTPAVGASLLLQPLSESAKDGGTKRPVLDGEGRATVAVRPGRWRVVLFEPGFVPAFEEVEVVAGETATVELREPTGGDLEVEVVDEAGRPCPFAAIDVHQPSGAPWGDVGEQGTQRLDPFTDVHGIRRLSRLEPGEIRLGVTWAGDRVETLCRVANGSRERVRVVWRESLGSVPAR